MHVQGAAGTRLGLIVCVCMCPAAFRSGAVMGFLLASLGLLVIYITIQIFFLVRLPAAHPAVACGRRRMHGHSACIHPW